MVMLLNFINICSGWAFDTKRTRLTLRGIKKVYVEVGPLREEIEKKGLTTKIIRRDMEARLQKAGIEVLTFKEWTQKRGPYLFVHSNTIKESNGVYISHNLIEVRQSVLLLRSPDIHEFAITWNIGVLVTSGDINDIRKVIKEQMEIFLDAFFSVNPR